MVTELLDEAQIQANTSVLHEGKFSPAALLQNTVSPMQVMAERKGLELAFSIDPDLPEELYGDENRLRQILDQPDRQLAEVHQNR